ncbi:MAG: outer membrane beta-barrel protein [Bacteroidia bacterium]
MKKILLIAALIMFSYSVNSQSPWNIGVMLSAGGNISQFSGGMEQANALFTHSVHPVGQLGVYARYRIAPNWSLQSGFDFSQIGFTYLFAKDYSLLNEMDHNEIMYSATCVSRMPAMIIYNSKLNCRNWRFIAGAGFALNVIDNNWQSSYNDIIECPTGMSEEQMKNYYSEYKFEEAHATSAANGSFTWLMGFEKVFKRGNMFSFTFQGNAGFTPLAESTVQYFADGTNYHHTFTNYGTYCSFGISYYFLPVGSKKLASAIEKK